MMGAAARIVQLPHDGVEVKRCRLLARRKALKSAICDATTACIAYRGECGGSAGNSRATASLTTCESAFVLFDPDPTRSKRMCHPGAIRDGPRQTLLPSRERTWP